MNEQSLLDKIEQKRNELIHIGLLYGLNSPNVVKESQELDKLLNLFEMKQSIVKSR